MAALSSNVVMWKYTDGKGGLWRRRAEKALTTQVDGSSNPLIGGSAGSAADPPFAKSFLKPRYALVHNDTYGNRRVCCYTATAPLLTLGTSINLTADGDSRAFVSTGETAERNIRVGSTAQST
jgi:hypothetical protein